MRGRHLSIWATVLAVAVMAPACGSKDKVGSGVKVGSGSGGQGAFRDTTTVPTTAPATTTTKKSAVVTTRPVVTTTTRPVPEAFIKIQDDEQGSYFEPKVMQIQRGHKLTWQNVGTKTRKVQADNGIFVSPPIAPGGTYSWTASTNGTFNYKDTTRPYTFGTVQVYG